MVKKIIYSNRAFADIDRIVEFNNLRNRSTNYSEKFIVRLNKRLSLLMKQPFSGIETDEDGRLVLVWDKYYVFYRLQEEHILISSIYHQKEKINR